MRLYISSFLYITSRLRSQTLSGLPGANWKTFAQKNSQGKHETVLRSFRREKGFAVAFDFN